jgi:hypothetical protein
VKDPANFATFDNAVARFRADRLRLDGLGIVLGNGLCGVDLDRCRDVDTGELSPWAQEAVAELDTYAEVSPSGTGVKLFAFGAVPTGRRKRGNVEVYDGDRFFTVTGLSLTTPALDVNERTEALAAFHAKHLGSPRPKSQPTREGNVPRGTFEDGEEEEWLRLACHKDHDFARLWAGDGTAYPHEGRAEGDLSRATFALAHKLAYWFGPDHARIESLVWRSGLSRPKLGERRGAGTWVSELVAKAVETQHDRYSGPPPGKELRGYASRYRESESLPRILGESCRAAAHSPTEVKGVSPPTVAISLCSVSGRRPTLRHAFDLARRFKSLPHVADGGPDGLQDAADAWYAKNSGKLSSVSRAEFLDAFSVAWREAAYPEGQGPIDLAFAAAKSRVLPHPFNGLVPELKLTSALCMELQDRAGDACFFLDCRTLGRLLGVHYTTAAKYLSSLRDCGWLTRTMPGSHRSRRASRYRWNPS